MLKKGKLDKKTFIILYHQLEPTETKVDEYAEYVFKGKSLFFHVYSLYLT